MSYELDIPDSFKRTIRKHDKSMCQKVKKKTSSASSVPVKTKEISREKAEELLINLETNKISPESIKAMFGEL